MNMAVTAYTIVLGHVVHNGPFQKLSRAMLVMSFGGQCRKKTAIFYKCKGFSQRLRAQ